MCCIAGGTDLVSFVSTSAGSCFLLPETTLPTVDVVARPLMLAALGLLSSRLSAGAVDDVDANRLVGRDVVPFSILALLLAARAGGSEDDEWLVFDALYVPVLPDCAA